MPRTSEDIMYHRNAKVQKLDSPIPHEDVSVRQGPGGTKLAYMSGSDAIATMNNIFGFDGWSSEIKTTSMLQGSGLASGHVMVVVTVRVWLTDGTASHEDTGFGKGSGSSAEGFEMAYKEAVTDALKRAMRQFGQRTGNCLYDKDFTDTFTKSAGAPHTKKFAK